MTTDTPNRANNIATLSKTLELVLSELNGKLFIAHNGYHATLLSLRDKLILDISQERELWEKERLR